MIDYSQITTQRTKDLDGRIFNRVIYRKENKSCGGCQFCKTVTDKGQKITRCRLHPNANIQEYSVACVEAK